MHPPRVSDSTRGSQGPPQVKDTHGPTGRKTGGAAGFSRAGLYPAGMVNSELLKLLRCPMDPDRNVELRDEETALVCSRCQLRFRIKDGFPNLVVEEAELPDGCATLKQLPCQSGP